MNTGNSYENTYFNLSSNIRLNNQEFDIIGSIDKPFNGHFNGNGYIIKDFKINGTGLYTGLFAYVQGSIENVGIVNATINSTSTTNGKYYTGVVAYLGEDGILKNVYSTGSITNNASYYSYVGGLVGYSEGTIECSYSTCNVTAKSSSLFAYAGGLVGCLDGIICYSFATGNVTANGANDSYSKNGGIVGDKTTGATIKESYRSDTQVLTKNSVSNKYYNDYGIIDDISNIVESIKTYWLANWGFNKTLPQLKLNK